MKFKLKHVIITGAAIATLILAPNTWAEKEIFPDMFLFAKKEMKIAKKYNTPTVHLVSRETIAELWRLSIRVNDWKIRLTTEQERFAYEDLLGTYSPQADLIYVINTLKPWAKAHVIVHEYVHWLQVHHLGKLLDSDPEAPIKRTMREMQAYQIGDAYLVKVLKRGFKKEDIEEDMEEVPHVK